MAQTARTTVHGGRWRLVLAAAVALTALTVGVARVAASDPAGSAGSATEPIALVAGTDTTAEPLSPFPAFVLDRGDYTSFEADDPAVQVFPTGINSRGTIVGEFVLPDVRESGLRRDPDGTITSFNVPGAAGTEAVSLNDRGVIVGSYSEDTPIVNFSARPRGYLLDGDEVTTVDFPGAVETAVTAVNNRGQAVGNYADADGTIHSFLWERGRFTPIDMPGADTTIAADINDRGQIVGYTSDAANTTAVGFLLERGEYTTIQAPGVPFITPTGINNRGQIAGAVYDDLDLTGARGFLLAYGAGGPFTPVNFPGAPRTLATDVNDRGQVIGIYENPAVPAPQQDGGTPPMDAPGPMG